MLIETRTKIKDEWGNPIYSNATRDPRTGEVKPDETSPEVELRDLVKRALDFFKEGADKKPSELGHRYDLTKQFFEDATIEDLPQHEVDYIMERAGECYDENPLFYGRLRDYFDQQAQLTKKKKEPAST